MHYNKYSNWRYIKKMLVANILRKKGLFDNQEDLKQEIKNRLEHLKLKGYDDLDIEFSKDDTQIEWLNQLQKKLTALEKQQPKIELIRNDESDLFTPYTPTPKKTTSDTIPAKRKSYNTNSNTTQIQIKKDVLKELSNWSKERKIPSYLTLETLIKMMLDDEILQSKLIDKYVSEYMKV